MNRDIVQRYLKRPIIVSAIQFTEANTEIIREFTGQRLSAFHRKNNKFYINTLEGMMLVNVGDYIVRGVADEYYCVREDIFNMTYEEVTDGTTETAVQLRDGDGGATEGL